jgi:hypothetical protein
MSEWGESTAQDQQRDWLLVADIVRDVVAEFAPDEIPLAEGMRQLGPGRAVRRLTRGRRSREPLAFGFGEVASLATAVAWSAIDQTARDIIDRNASGAGAWLRRIFRRPRRVLRVPPLTREQLAEVRRSVLEIAERERWEAERAVVLADCVVARLVLKPPAGAVGSDPGDDGMAVQ